MIWSLNCSAGDSKVFLRCTLPSSNLAGSKRRSFSSWRGLPNRKFSESFLQGDTNRARGSRRDTHRAREPLPMFPELLRYLRPQSRHHRPIHNVAGEYASELVRVQCTPPWCGLLVLGGYTALEFNGRMTRCDDPASRIKDLLRLITYMYGVPHSLTKFERPGALQICTFTSVSQQRTPSGLYTRL